MNRLLAILVVSMMASQADAQIFRRPSASQSYGHWSYPGDIASHLLSTHGRSVAGMSREQMLDMHDALHEGRSVAVQSKTVAVTIAKAQFKQVEIVAPAKIDFWK